MNFQRERNMFFHVFPIYVIWVYQKYEKQVPVGCII
jgi:hypothetical protein